jgi:hypothetical protein
MKLMRLPHNYEEASLLCPKCGSIDIRPSRKSAVVGRARACSAFSSLRHLLRGSGEESA